VLSSPSLRLLFSFNSLQGFIEPFTTVGAEIFPHFAANLLKSVGVRKSIDDLFTIAGGRIYLDITGLAQDSRLRVIVQALLGNADPGALQAYRTIVANGRIKTVSTASPINIARTVFKLRRLFFGIVRAWSRPEAERVRRLDKVDHYFARVQADITSAKTLQERLTVIDKFAKNGLFDMVFFSILPLAATGIMSQTIIDRWLVHWLGEAPKSVRKLLRGLPGNPTTEMDLMLWETATKIRDDSASSASFKQHSADEIARLYHAQSLPPVARQALQNFLDRYGMRAVGEIDMGRPRWREDPRSIIQTITSFLSIDKPENAPDYLFQNARAEVEQKSAEYISQVEKKKGGLHARLFRFVLRRMQLSGTREMPKFYMIKYLDLFRIALLESGRELTAQGKLACPEDVFFLPLHILHDDTRSDLKVIAAQQREAYEQELTRRQIPRLILSTGEVFYQGVSEAGPNELLGDGVSPGSVEGNVRVVHDPRGVRLIPGEILVCPATDPGWTPLFLSAGGLVTEMGGMMTHGSVVAREYGIPAVVGVDDATRRLTTGQRIRVDGSTGRVTLLDAMST
jgi:pyruvate,water dikinase